MNILVIRFSSMGDVILATPLFTELKNRYSGAALTFVTTEKYAPLFHDDGRLRETVVADKTMNELPPYLNSRNWDLVVDLQNNRQSRSMVKRLGERAIRTGRFDKLHAKRFALLFLRIDTYDSAPGVAQRYIHAGLGSLPESDPPSPQLHFAPEACLKAKTAFEEQTDGIERPSLALFPFSAWKNKQWPWNNYIEVGRYFLAKGWNVALFGGPEDAANANELRERIGARCVSHAGTHSLYQIGCLLTHFSLALGNDTGLMHLARACGVKAGIIFGPTTRHFGFFPYGKPSFALFQERLFCRPCHAHGGNVCFRGDHRCMRGIYFKRVIEGMEELLKTP
ncbi:MAG: glycosyltransferase family 9 protein [Chitinispirillaceae bacterium]|nr:glycosyltransferase family 9 protein [Chitinispirillaceae bacterium]